MFAAARDASSSEEEEEEVVQQTTASGDQKAAGESGPVGNPDALSHQACKHVPEIGMIAQWNRGPL